MKGYSPRITASSCSGMPEPGLATALHGTIGFHQPLLPIGFHDRKFLIFGFSDYRISGFGFGVRSSEFGVRERYARKA